MEMLTNYLVPEIVVACLIVGYILKHWIKDVDNKWIPSICCVAGLAAAWITNPGDLSLDVFVGGALSGLASTGLHQMFKQWLDNGGE